MFNWLLLDTEQTCSDKEEDMYMNCYKSVLAGTFYIYDSEAATTVNSNF